MEELRKRIEIEDLEKIVRDLQLSADVLDKMRSERYRQLEEAKEKLAMKRIEHMDDEIPKYEAKLNRLKKFIEAFVEENPRASVVRYRFNKIKDPYKDDFHDVMADPLEYILAEYNLLDMENYIEIVFDYYNEALRDFIKMWMSENVEYAEHYPGMMFKLKEQNGK